MNKTLFDEEQTKALLTMYYEKYEGIKVESVTIKPRVLPNDEFVKSFDASAIFIVKFCEEIAGIKKINEQYLEIDDVCGFITTYFENEGFRNLLVSVRPEVDKAVWNKNSVETDRKAHFDGLVFEYEYKEDITKAADNSENLSNDATPTDAPTKAKKPTSSSSKTRKGGK